MLSRMLNILLARCALRTTRSEVINLGGRPRGNHQMLNLAKDLAAASESESAAELQEALDDLIKIHSKKLSSKHNGLEDKESVIKRRETILANLTTEPISARRLLDKLIEQGITIYTIQSVAQVLGRLARAGEIGRITRNGTYCYFLKEVPPQDGNSN